FHEAESHDDVSANRIAVRFTLARRNVEHTGSIAVFREICGFSAAVVARWEDDVFRFVTPGAGIESACDAHLESGEDGRRLERAATAGCADQSGRSLGLERVGDEQRYDVFHIGPRSIWTPADLSRGVGEGHVSAGGKIRTGNQFGIQRL